MTIQEFLFSFTFVWGVVHLLTTTPLFKKELQTFLELLVYVKLPPFWGLLSYWIFYSSLFYQVYFWAKYLKIV